MNNRSFLYTYAIMTWVYILASVLVPLAPELAIGAMVMAFVAMIGSAIVRAKSAGRNPFYGLGILVPVYQLFVLVELGK